MGAGRIAIAIVGLVVAALAWQHDALRHALQPLGLGTAGPAADKPVASGARRCAGAGGAVVYTDEPCPPGTREQPLDRGTVTVLPAPRPAAAPASARPLLRQWAPDADGPTIKDRVADRVP